MNKNALFLYWLPESKLFNVVRSIEVFKKIKQINFKFLNFYKKNILTFKNNINIDKYDFIIIHNTLSYNIDNLLNLELKLKNFGGKKIIFLQDESLQSYRKIKYIIKNNFDYIFTLNKFFFLDCLKTLKIKKKIKKKNIIEYYPLYFNDYLIKNALRICKKTIDISYRATKGNIDDPLIYQKYILANKLKEKLNISKIKFDISNKKKDLLYNFDWIKFLNNSTISVSAMSGTLTITELEAKSIFSLKNLFYSFCRIIKPETFLKKKYDSLNHKFKKKYTAISPRIFEYIATNNIIFLTKNTKINILKKNIHYLELNEDLSNLIELIKISKSSLGKKILDNCKRDFLFNEFYHENHFIKKYLNPIFQK